MCCVMPPASRRDLGAADVIEQRGLAVIDAAHDRHHGGRGMRSPTPSALLGMHPRSLPGRCALDPFRPDGSGFLIQHLVDGHHAAHAHHGLDDRLPSPTSSAPAHRRFGLGMVTGGSARRHLETVTRRSAPPPGPLLQVGLLRRLPLPSLLQHVQFLATMLGFALVTFLAALVLLVAGFVVACGRLAAAGCGVDWAATGAASAAGAGSGSTTVAERIPARTARSEPAARQAASRPA